ncbi:MAG: hypothetical protein KTR14_06535 [Vampirovibrio sp.]|nr:hypothetical protein [Vampirovibrio sp.]
MEQNVTKEAKLSMAKDIVANYVRGEKSPGLSADEVCDMLKKVYTTIEEIAPEKEKRPIGLGS